MATKEELLQQANELGVEIPQGAKASKITALIKAAKATAKEAAKLEEITKQANELGVEIPQGADYDAIAELVIEAKVEKDAADKEAADAAADAEEEVKAKDDSAVYIGCKILGGLKVVISVDGEQKNIILKSANSKSTTPDMSIKFNVNPHEYGITIVTAAEAALIKKQIGNALYVKKGFVFFAKSQAEANKCAVELGKHKGINIKTGLEPLTVEDIKKTVEVFKGEE